jgi:Caspase domain
MSRIVLSAVALALGLLSTPIWADPVPGDRRVALVVGNSAYRHAPILPNPAGDAKALAVKLKNAGFEVVEAQYEVGYLDFKRAIRKFEDTAADSDIAVVYFAGHGIEIHGVNYLIPVDAKLASDRDAEDEAITLDRLLDSVDGARRVRLVILDACRDNPFARNMKHQRTASVRGINPGLVAVEPSSTNTLIAFAAKAGSVAEDGEQEHSPFAAALLDHLFVPGLDLRFAFGRIRDDVLKNTSNRQEPFVYGSLGKDNVALVPGPKQEYAMTPSDLEGEKSDYNLVEKIGTRGAWEVFLAQHANGFYSELARQQIDKLKSAEAAQITVAAYEPSKTPTPIGPSTDEQRAWDKIKDSNDASDFRAFIKRYPSSPLANKAQTHLDAIARAEEEKAWNKIKGSGDPAKLRDFIKKYPASPLAATAQSNLDTLAHAAQEREEKARAEREAKAAEEARQRAEHEAALQREEKERQEKIAETRRQAAEAARQKAEEEAALKRAQQEAKAAEEARRKAERDAALKAEEDQRQKKAQEAARARQETEAARQRAEEERQRKAEEAARAKLEAEASHQKAEQEAALKRAQEQAKAAEESRLNAEREAELKREEEERQKQAAEAARLNKTADAEAAPQRAEQEAALERAREEANAAKQARLEAEREATLKREQEAKPVEQARLQAEREAALKREQQEQQKKAAEAALARRQAEAVAAQKKAEQQATSKREEEERRRRAEEAAHAKQEAEEAARKEAEQHAALKRAEEEAKAAEQARRRAEREAAAPAKEQAACKREEDHLSSLKDAGKKALSDLRQLEQGLTCEKLRPLVTAALDRVNAMPDVNTPAQIRSAQQELTRLGCFAGEVDGSLSATKTAVRRYQSERSNPTGNVEITDAFLTELKEQSTRVCPLVCPHGKVVAGEHCVAAQKPPAVVHLPKEEPAVVHHPKEEDEGLQARRHVKHEEESTATRRRARIEEERPAPHHREVRPVAAPRIRQEAVGYSGGGHSVGATIGVGF